MNEKEVKKSWKKSIKGINLKEKKKIEKGNKSWIKKMDINVQWELEKVNWKNGPQCKVAVKNTIQMLGGKCNNDSSLIEGFK